MPHASYFKLFVADKLEYYFLVFGFDNRVLKDFFPRSLKRIPSAVSNSLSFLTCRWCVLITSLCTGYLPLWGMCFYLCGIYLAINTVRCLQYVSIMYTGTVVQTRQKGRKN